MNPNETSLYRAEVIAAVTRHMNQDHSADCTSRRERRSGSSRAARPPASPRTPERAYL
jgi:hypothetical protein